MYALAFVCDLLSRSLSLFIGEDEVDGEEKQKRVRAKWN